MRMKISTKIIIAAIIVIIVPIVYYTNKRLAAETLVGCYVAHVDKDIYTLTIQSHDTTVVRGILSYQNFERDSSAGTFSGSYTNNVLLGDYSSRAEGMDFIRQVVFLRDGDTFYQGSGEMQPEGNRQVFLNPAGVSFNKDIAFKKDKSCNK